jgi:hypothetical protein
MTDDELIACFEAGDVPPGGFHHRQHVRAAWRYLCREPLGHALERFRTALRRFAEKQGAPGLYHETITTAYVLLIAERVQASGRDGSWESFAAANPDLFAWKPFILDRYYTPETLASDAARATFVAPDRGEAAPGAADAAPSILQTGPVLRLTWVEHVPTRSASRSTSRKL